uniref:Uncharacterized protein n=1 Tax=Quercus lobata TaxID=97700 RepID=A0A7N2R3Y5_QUELO
MALMAMTMPNIADLENEPGLFISNKEKVFAEADAMARKNREKLPSGLPLINRDSLQPMLYPLRMRKEFQEERERAEIRVNNPMESENQPAMETQAETNQANMVTNEGVIPVININELPVTNELAINATLLPDEDIDSIPPTAVTVLTDANNNGEPKTKEIELIPDSITPENLFDIQIKQIDTDLARYDKD